MGSSAPSSSQAARFGTIRSLIAASSCLRSSQHGAALLLDVLLVVRGFEGIQAAAYDCLLLLILT